MALFQRTTRKVDLTQAGEQLMISARKAMAEIDAGLVQIQHAVNVQQGICRLVAPQRLQEAG